MEKAKVYYTDFRTTNGVGLPEKLKRLCRKAGMQTIDMDNKFVAINFPITVKGQGIVGAVAVSGLPDPADHVYVIAALEKILGAKAPAIPDEIDESWIN